jgi:hypothetical protein
MSSRDEEELEWFVRRGRASDHGGVATNCYEERTRREKKKEKRVIDSESGRTSYLYSPLLPC